MPELAHFDQYFGVYVMHDERLQAMVQQIKSMDLQAHVLEQREFMAEAGPIGAYAIQDGVAVIDVKGTMTKYGSSLSQMRHGTIGVRKAIRNATQNKDVKSILIFVESPGGTAQGTQDLADEVARAASKKQVTAYIEDIGASAAYWVASQADRIIANSSAMVGSIGTYGVVYDYSEMARMDGVKVHVVRAGAFKANGVKGEEVTHEALADYQRVVNEINDLFVAGITKGRRLSNNDARALADGRIHIASRAIDMKLIDEIGGFETALNSLIVGKKGRSSIGAVRHGDLKMDQEQTVSAGTPTKPQPATIGELKALCQGATPEFILAQFESGATAISALSAWSAIQAKEIADAKAKATEADEKMAAKSKADADGVPPLSNGGKAKGGVDEDGDPIALFDSHVRKLTANGMPRIQAVQAVARKYPQLHEQFLIATNSGKRARRLIEEKYEYDQE
jgi:protease-4